MKTTATILAGVLAAQQVVATGWGESSQFSCPANTNNQCDQKQQGGWDFGDLPTGPFTSYGSHGFSGFTCKSSNKRARDLTRRGAFSGNCIVGSAHSGGGPGFQCSSGQEGFSVNQIHVSTDHDQDVEFHYAMPGGQTCKHTSPCKSGGNVVQNDQCGGATSFSVQLPQTATTSCGVSIYSVSFDCSTASSTVPPKTTPSVYVPPYSQPPFPSKSTTPESPVTTSSVPSPYSPPKVSSSPSLPPFPSYTTKPSVPLYTGPSSPASPVGPSSTPSIPVYTPPSSAPSVPVYTPPGSAPSSPASPQSPSIPVYTPPGSTPSVPVYTPPGSAPSSPASPQSPSIPPYSAPSAPTTPASPVTTPSTPVPSSSCPPVLPMCLNTWMFQTGCSDNGDYACYCKQPDFASKVCGCLSSYGADEDETAKAVSFLLGICSDFVGSNYGLAMNCPAPSSPAGPSTTPQSPVTPVTTWPETQTTVVVTQTISTCPAGQTVTSGTITTTLATPSPSTIFITSTSTICTKCTAPPPVTNGPAPSSPVSPVTTISISTTLTVPATYSTGESVGLTIPSSSTPTVVATSYTVPQVYPTSPAGSSSGGLVFGPAPTSPASPVAGVPGSPSGGFGTAIQPTGTSTSPLAVFTGAANKMAAGSFGGLVVAGLALAL